uniref:hypothetical protein n=1 Tax=Candidatus Phytoplasma asiaticum TaxID=2763338 RepID=UPI0018797D79|nr:hypothetical protein ['Parthenium hysterophorus' phyllody phytoplasma]
MKFLIYIIFFLNYILLTAFQLSESFYFATRYSFILNIFVFCLNIIYYVTTTWLFISAFVNEDDKEDDVSPC